ncbi:MAG TPA: sialidase family protein, partial [Acidimicrobiales bacterium]|nr:sialidase family protein [Acidimicrobiales bacterium]
FRSDSGGTDLFAQPCGPLVTDPAIEANVPTDVTGGTLVSKPVVDPAGNLYVMFTTTTQDQNLAALAAGKLSGTFSQVYMAVSSDHCQSFTDYTAFDGHTLGSNTVQFGDIFNALAIDGSGALYAVAAGFVGTEPFPPVANLYVLSSKDHGKTWTKPVQVGPVGAHMLPAAFGGPRAGQLAIGFFRTTNGVTDPGASGATWTYMAGVSTNATSATPSFSLNDVDRGAVYFQGAICNMGILCTSGRDLLDFTSATVDAAGCPLFTFAGEPVPGGKVFNYVTRQTSGCFRTR